MRSSLDSQWLLAAGYLLVAGSAVFTGRRERERADADDRWPVLWYSTAACAVIVAVARFGGLGDVATRIGRTEAYAEGWYDGRRMLQAVVIVVVALAALTAPFVLAHLAGRHRRHLPALLALCALGGYDAIRLVSLHQVDDLLGARRVAGVRAGTWVELTLLGVAVLAVAWTAPRSAGGSDRSWGAPVESRSDLVR